VEIDGVTVISPHELQALPNIHILITCGHREEINAQLARMGFDKNNIMG
jgi:hypothetical protein